MTNNGDCPLYTTLESEIGMFDSRNRRQRRADARAKRKSYRSLEGSST